MGLVLLTERHAQQMAGMLTCCDRLLVQGTWPVFSYAEGMTSYLTQRRVRIFDFAQFPKPLTDEIKAHAEALAAAHGLSIDYVRQKNFRKEDEVKARLEVRGSHPGLVWIFSALEPCTTYPPWHDKPSRRTYLRYDDGKCLHCYFYFIDEELGLCWVRVPARCPFRLQFDSNGHNWLARPLDRQKIGYPAGQCLHRDSRWGCSASIGGRLGSLFFGAAHCYKYYLTSLGQQVIALGPQAQRTGDRPGTRAAPR
jgi:hypothetical protein